MLPPQFRPCLYTVSLDFVPLWIDVRQWVFSTLVLVSFHVAVHPLFHDSAITAPFMALLCLRNMPGGDIFCKTLSQWPEILL